MSRSQRQTLQLVAVGVLVLLLIGWFVSTRGSSDGTAGSGQVKPAATKAAVATAPKSGASSPAASGAPKTAAGQTDPVSGLRFVDESALPKEARETLRLIRAGGPYPYPRNDDKTFSNAERILPKQPSGYYREYTVITPGSPDRGARRIIAGDGGELYYTADHYSSFQRIREGT